jgi:hypothetical protein
LGSDSEIRTNELGWVQTVALVGKGLEVGATV